MSKPKHTIVGIGEVVWDFFPEAKQVGGAPANFAYFAQVLGNRGIVVSRVGSDPLGAELCSQLQGLGLRTEYIQIDQQHATGTVMIQISSTGQPRYSIATNVAWDYLEWNAQLEQLAAEAHALCFGSLAQRSPISSSTIRKLLRSARRSAVKVFDINLREDFYSREILFESIKLSNIVKLNSEEVYKLRALLNVRDGSEVSLAQQLIRQFDLALVCLTRGAHGSVLVSREEVNEHPGVAVNVQDTVGAGDAFTAAVVSQFLKGASLKTMNEVANRLGAVVASKPGACPEIEEAVIQELLIQ